MPSFDKGGENAWLDGWGTAVEECGVLGKSRFLELVMQWTVLSKSFQLQMEACSGLLT